MSVQDSLRIVSVSLGTSKRNRQADVSFLGRRVSIERVGTDGDKDRYRELVCSLDGQVDCFGIGGTDAYLYAGTRRYAFRETLWLMEGARQTPWVDGSGLKHTLERETVAYLQDSGEVDFATKRVLLVVGVDRFGMAEALASRAKSIAFGDLPYGLGIPIAIRSWPLLAFLARIALPIVVHAPIEWLYPTGAKQDVNTPRFEQYFREADVIAGDWHVIRRFMPMNMEGKVVLTQSSQTHEVELLRERGVATLVTTTPEIAGSAFATNVMEAVLVALSGKRPDALTASDYLGTLRELGWQPSITHLQNAR